MIEDASRPERQMSGLSMASSMGYLARRDLENNSLPREERWVRRDRGLSLWLCRGKDSKGR